MWQSLGGVVKFNFVVQKKSIHASNNRGMLIHQIFCIGIHGVEKLQMKSKKKKQQKRKKKRKKKKNKSKEKTQQRKSFVVVSM